jgi:hypothetical protein
MKSKLLFVVLLSWVFLESGKEDNKSRKKVKRRARDCQKFAGAGGDILESLIHK